MQPRKDPQEQVEYTIQRARALHEYVDKLLQQVREIHNRLQAAINHVQQPSAHTCVSNDPPGAPRPQQDQS